MSATESAHYISLGEYADFLNDVGASDPHHLYDGKMATGAALFREGTPGNYCYKAEGAEESLEAPILFLSYNDLIAYCAWKNTNDAQSFSLQPLASSLLVDEELKINDLDLFLEDSAGASTEQNSGHQISRSTEMWIGLGALGALLGGGCYCLRGSSSDERPGNLRENFKRSDEEQRRLGTKGKGSEISSDSTGRLNLGKPDVEPGASFLGNTTEAAKKALVSKNNSSSSPGRETGELPTAAERLQQARDERDKLEARIAALREKRQKNVQQQYPFITYAAAKRRAVNKSASEEQMNNECNQEIMALINAQKERTFPNDVAQTHRNYSFTEEANSNRVTPETKKLLQQQMRDKSGSSNQFLYNQWIEKELGNNVPITVEKVKAMMQGKAQKQGL